MTTPMQGLKFQSTTPKGRHQTAMGASFYGSKRLGRTTTVPLLVSTITVG